MQIRTHKAILNYAGVCNVVSNPVTLRDELTCREELSLPGAAKPELRALYVCATSTLFALQAK